MKVLFVVNNLYAPGNGLSASARRTMEQLARAGVEVRSLSGPNPDAGGPQPDWRLKELHIPIFDPLIHAQGYSFAASEKAVIRQAVAWADVVHLEEPFLLQIHARKIAEELGVPCTATYHLHPENISASIRLAGWRLPNHTLLRIWRDRVFNHCTDVQCPTQNVMDRLRRFHFRSELRLISNGILRSGRALPAGPDAAPAPGAPWRILCTGRYSYEKDQMTLLRAMEHSRHAREIQLVFAGRGPLAEKYQRAAERLVERGVLRYPPVFRFMDMEELAEAALGAALYVHCATVEVEGLACLEALRYGVVPVIAEGELTATAQFALEPESVFPAGDARALAGRIDEWLEHGERRRESARRYLRIEERYDIRDSAAALTEMFRHALETGSRRTR